MHASAFVACLLKKKYTEIIKVITRCHRFDLYEYHSTDEYIPMRNFIYKNIDEIHSISIDGIEYLTSKEPSLKNKLILSRLGTKDHGFISHIKNKPLKLVSCSWIRPVKRVDLIIDALAECDITLEWTHFGNGEDFNKLIDKANNLRKNNIKIILPGSKCNEEVINAYKENKYDVFINVSSSEGIPVSIMEAMSMGMIIIATAVGGTPEVVDKTNGFLLDPNFSNKELIDILNFINNMDEKEYVKMKLSSRNKWEKSFSADRNYASFYSHLLK